MEQNSFNHAQGFSQGQVPVNNYAQTPMQNQAQPPYQTPYYNNTPQPPQKKKKSVLSCHTRFTAQMKPLISMIPYLRML